MTALRIGDAAASLGIPAHVLRHWEDVGVLETPRLANGHRVFDDETITRAHLIRLCQRAGMSLAEIATLHRSEPEVRVRMVRGQLDRFTEQIRQLSEAADFLRHTLVCRHPIASTCPECSGFAAGEA